MKKVVVIIALVLTLCFVVGCSDRPTEAEKEHTAQIIKELEGVQAGDIIETKEGSLAVVVRRLDEYTRVKFVCTNQVVNWQDFNTADKIKRIIHFGDEDWCLSSFQVLIE